MWSLITIQMEYKPATFMDELSLYEVEKGQKVHLEKEFTIMLTKVESRMKALTDLATKLSAIDRWVNTINFLYYKNQHY